MLRGPTDYTGMPSVDDKAQNKTTIARKHLLWSVDVETADAAWDEKYERRKCKSGK